MKKSFLIFGSIVLAAILETSVFPIFFSTAKSPDVMLISLLAATVVFGFFQSWKWSIAAGFIIDIFSFSRIGSNVVALIFCCYLVSFFSRRLLLGEKIGGILVNSLLVVIATIFYNVWLLVANSGFADAGFFDINRLFWEKMGWKIIFNLILFLILLLFFKRLEKNKPSLIISHS